MKNNLVILLLLCSCVTYAQLNDDFTDGNFTANPVWTGSSSGADFTVNANRLRSNSILADNNFYLSTANTLALNCKWEFWVNLHFSTSGANYTDAYLISDKADLQSELINGYFVRIGNKEDEISLYKRSGTLSNSIKIIDGENSSVSSSNNTIKIRVSRNSSGLFTLEREVVSTGSSYFTEATATDLSFTTSSYFGIFIQQSTSTFSQKHFFDDFKIGALISDTIPPALSSAIVIDSNTIEIEFSKAMDSISVKNKDNFTINSAIGSPVNVFSTTDLKKFRLRLASPLNTGTYMLTVTNVKDKSGNIIKANNTASFSYVKPYITKFRDLVINELFSDPTPQIDLPSVEFVELLNTTNETISLKNWKFSDNSTSATLDSTNIAPHSFIILCAKADTAEYKKFGKVMSLSPWPSLNNSGDALKLTSAENSLIDSIAYSDTWYRDAAKKSGGWSLERIDPLSKCDGLFNWTASKDVSGGTPGKQNSAYIPAYDLVPLTADSLILTSDTTLSLYFNKHLNSATLIQDNFSLSPTSGTIKTITANTEYKQVALTFSQKFVPGTDYVLTISNVKDCSGNTVNRTGLSFKTPANPPPTPEKTDTAKIYITEIFADPSPEVGLPLVEFIEIYNPSKDTVDLEGWTINDQTSKSTFKKLLILPNQYVVLCPLADTAQYKTYGKTIGLSPWTSLSNSSDQIVLKSFKKRMVDSIAYSDTWYRDAAKKSGGWSLEKIDISKNSCRSFFNWTASANPNGGTPGKLNSVNMPGYLNRALKIDSVTLISDNTVILFLNLIPDTTFIKPSYFNISNGIGKAQSAGMTYDYKKIILRFSEKFQEGNDYIVSADSLFTCSGILTGNPDNQAFFTIPLIQEIDYPIIINEIFADPSPVIGLPEIEFVELFNPTDKVIGLKGLSYGDQTSSYRFTSGELTAGAYLILCPAKDTLSYTKFGKVIGLPTWPSLRNEAGILILKNNKGREIQRVVYGLNWYKNTNKSKGGYTLELIDSKSTCSNIQNWSASIDPSGGTPGKQNSVYRANTSSDPLKLLKALLVDSITLSLSFNRYIDSLPASVIANFTLNNGVGSPILALPLAPNFDQVILKLREPLARGHTYRITVSNIVDCKGSLIAPEFNSSELILPRKIVKGDILFTEILFNPRPDGVDFVEIYNNTEYLLDMQELSLAAMVKDTLSNLKQLITTQLLMEPRQYLVLTINPDNIKKEYHTEEPGSFLKMPSFPTFNNDAGTAVLISHGIKIDQFTYVEKMHFSLIKNFEGVSLERSSFKRSANDPGNFRSATAAAGFATPGYKNSQYTDDQTTNEEFILISKTFSPDNDGFEDILQMNYHFKNPGLIANVSIFNDQGILIKKLLKNFMLSAEGAFIWDGLNEFNQLAASGIYLIYAEFFDTKGNLKKYRKTCALAVKF